MMTKTTKAIVLSLLLALIPLQSFAATTSDSVTSEIADISLSEGKVKSFNKDTQTILLQLKSGEKLTIVLDWNTALVGYSSLDEIVKKDKVKIWYSNDGQQSKAVKVEKKLMVGC